MAIRSQAQVTDPTEKALDFTVKTETATDKRYQDWVQLSHRHGVNGINQIRLTHFLNSWLQAYLLHHFSCTAFTKFMNSWHQDWHLENHNTVIQKTKCKIVKRPPIENNMDQQTLLELQQVSHHQQAVKSTLMWA